ncbi:hypothetical protein OPT61_g2891 [Boeremia exigua]|uniref:Uncharacterized protein n=1 Tax=Boeremia exigua TaxID=749465 RepID=A0ACC2IK24_9PLEO|nr:hypothetical protein OPT61_g2891 [Boeremia exigua]
MLSTSMLLAGSLANTVHPNVHAVADLVARAIDPATMDPTKLSVLSVLKTAIPTPTGTDIVLPTGDAAPQWYKDLPADVMVLLAQMYPAAPTTAATTSETTTVPSSVGSSAMQETAGVSVSQTTLTVTLELGPTPTAALNNTLSTGSSGGTSANNTISTALPSSTQSAISTGAKTTVGAGKWSVVMGLGVAAVFCLFA